MKLFVTMDFNSGRVYNNELIWKCPEVLDYFKDITRNTIIVVGEKTVKFLPTIKNCNIICISKNPDTILGKNKDITIVNSINKIYTKGKKELMLVGYEPEICKHVFKSGKISKIYRININSTFVSYTYFNPKFLDGFIIKKEQKSTNTRNIYQLLKKVLLSHRGVINKSRQASTEYQYLELLHNVCKYGTIRQGRNGTTRSIFMNTMKFDMRDGFPLLTTKKMFLRGIVEEFLFFLRGDSDTSILSEANVKIWEGNTNKEFLASQNLPYAPGVMGPMYGYQWRHFNAPYLLDKNGKPLVPKGGLDQIEKVVNLIRKDPHSRRILLTSYNPSQASEGVLYPCHSIIIQFYVEDNYLDMSCYNRSQDIFLGVPYNIASSSLLLSTVSTLTSKKPRYLSMIMGDTHLYECHLQQAELQISRIPYTPPSLVMPTIKNIDDITKLKATDFVVKDYKYHKSIKAKMVA